VGAANKRAKSEAESRERRRKGGRDEKMHAKGKTLNTNISFFWVVGRGEKRESHLICGTPSPSKNQRKTMTDAGRLTGTGDRHPY